MTEASAGGFAGSVLKFSVTQALLVALAATALSAFVWTSLEGQRAVRASAWLAVSVQVATFAIARLVARQNIVAGWGLGVLLRFAAVAMWAFLGVKALELAPAPALLSLVIFFFVSTLIEPLFLNA